MTATLAPPARRQQTQRDTALDLLRAFALVRVILWHTFAVTWMTYFAAIPLMFFVAGTLLSASQERRAYVPMVGRRLRRLLLPLWAYGLVVAAGGAVRAARAGELFSLSRSTLSNAASWVFPLVDPSSAAWHGGWLSGHLWYLRAYLWIVLLAPILAVLARRLKLAVPLFLVGVVLVELAARADAPMVGAGRAHVIVGDAFTYGLFVVLGMGYQRYGRRIQHRLCAYAAAVGVALFAAYVVLIGLPGGDVNQSYPAIVLTGITWLLVAAAAERPIRRLADRTPVRRISRQMSFRAETIYLWHPAAIVLAYALADHWAPVAVPQLSEDLHLLSKVVVLGLTLALTALATLTIGWIEDIAARRRLPRRWLHVRTARVVALGAPIAVALAVAAPLIVLPAKVEGTLSGSRVQRPLRPPSYREALADSAFAAAAGSLPIEKASATSGLPSAKLQAALERWAAKQPDLQSVGVAVAAAGQVWTGDSGTDSIHHDDVYAIASITKSFTITLVLQQVATGKIALDSPMPRIAGIPAPAATASITPRMLLNHSSGLVDYSLAKGFDQNRTLTPAAAVALSLRSPLQAPPGTEVHYANSGYLWLGLLLEKVTGRPYSELVTNAAKSAGLEDTFVDPASIPGWVGFSSGGVHSTLADVARWEQAMFTPNRLLPAALVDQLTTLGPLNVGLGTWPLCPCGTDPQGGKTYTAIGHYVGNGGTYRYPDGMSLVVHVDPPSANSEARIVELGAALRAARSAK